HDKYFCAKALRAFLTHLEKLSVSIEKWIEVLDILAFENRDDLLGTISASRPTLIRLGGGEAFYRILQAVRDVCKQWP
ncbi:MAG: hypothetical protein AAF766_20140, partial [Cyanobacteria bacterium P01_D01_bin.14]